MSIQDASMVSETAESMAEEVLSRAREQAEAIIREAENKAAEILGETRRKAAERRMRLIEQGKSDLNRFKEHELIKIRIEFKKKLYEHAWSLIYSIMSDAAAALEKVRVERKELYKKFLLKSLDNAIDLINGEEIVIHADKRDKKLIDEAISSLRRNRRIKVMFDLTTAGGFIATSENSLQEMDETLESRLRLKSKIVREKLYSLLFGDLNVGDW